MVTYGGSGDPERTMQLLWVGEQPRPASMPGPKASLTLDRIVTAAIAIADERDDATVSLRAVAQRLGCTAMALYTHVGGKGELLDIMYDRVHAELTPPLAGPWNERVTAWALQLVELYVRHPWATDVSLVRPVLGPHEQQALENLLDALRPAELPAGDVAAIASALFSLARMTARTITDARNAGSDTATDDDAWWSARVRALASVVPDFPDLFPLSARLASSDVTPTDHSCDHTEHPGEAAPPLMERAARRTFDRTIRLLLSGAAGSSVAL